MDVFNFKPLEEIQRCVHESPIHDDFQLLQEGYRSVDLRYCSRNYILKGSLYQKKVTNQTFSETTERGYLSIYFAYFFGEDCVPNFELIVSEFDLQCWEDKVHAKEEVKSSEIPIRRVMAPVNVPSLMTNKNYK